MRKVIQIASLFALATANLLTGCSSASERASEILEATDVKGGLIVHVGCGDGILTSELRAGDRFLVQGLDPDVHSVEEASRRIRMGGLSRFVTVKHWPHDFLPYADDFVNLVVAENLGQISTEEVMRVLVPKGVAYIKTEDKWVKKVKPWPDEIDEWTHWLHGPDNNPVAQDMRVGPPRRVQWIASPKWPKSHDSGPSMTGMVSAAGRIFYVADDGPAGIKHPEHKLERWTLFARDAFNGLLLWKRPIVDWGARAWSPDDYPFPFGPWTVNPRMIHRQLIASGEHVYITLGFTGPVCVLDAATGITLKTLEGTNFASEILLDEGRLFAVIDRAAQRAGKYTLDPAKSVVAVDLGAGEILWEKAGLLGVEDRRQRGLAATLTRLYLTSGGGRLFVLEEADVIALDAATGAEIWRRSRPEKVDLRNRKHTHPVNDPYDLGSMLYSDGVLYCWQPHLPPSLQRFWQYRMEIQAISVSDGKILWKRICGGVGFSSFASVYLARGLIWVQSPPIYTTTEVQETYDLLGLDPKSGEVTEQHSVEGIFKDKIHHHRCYQNKATEKYIIYSRNGLEYVDLNAGDIDVNRWVRGMCQYGIMPANGLIYSPTQPCACFPSARLSGYYALSAEGGEGGARVESSGRLKRGPAYGQETEEVMSGSDTWSMYRGNQQRSGATETEVSPELEQVWRVEFEEPITAPTIASNTVYVATLDSHRVCAVDESNGVMRWSYQAGNRVDTPPTLSAGRVYFGTADGHVHCLRSTDGALVWRLDSSPEVRHIMSYANVESAWPVHGSVLVNRGVVYFCAGRSSYLDGGLRFYAVDAETGEVLRTTRYSSIGDEVELKGKGARGTFNDILVSDGRSLFLKNLTADKDTLAIEIEGWSYIPGARTWPGSPLSAVGGFLDDSLFDRVGWVLDNHLIAKMMVFNDHIVYGMNWRERPSFWHRNLFQVGESEYRVFARSRSRKGAVGGPGEDAGVQKGWQISVPVRVGAMTLTRNALFFAGDFWTGEEEDSLNLLERGSEGLLQVVQTVDGKLLSEYRLKAPPVWDGMAASGGRLLISIRDGSLLCLGQTLPDEQQTVRIVNRTEPRRLPVPVID